MRGQTAETSISPQALKPNKVALSWHMSGFQVASFQQSPGNLALYKSIEMDCCLRTAKRQMCFPGMLPQRDVLRPQPAIEFRDRTCFFAHQARLGQSPFGSTKETSSVTLRRHIIIASNNPQIITCHHNSKHRGERRYPLKMLKRTHCCSSQQPPPGQSVPTPTAREL